MRTQTSTLFAFTCLGCVLLVAYVPTQLSKSSQDGILIALFAVIGFIGMFRFLLAASDQ